MMAPGDPTPHPSSPRPSPATGVHAAAPETALLSEFTLDLAKAMLRTGYYAPEHPHAQQSRAGLYEKFGQALGDRSALTYLVGGKGDDRTVMIDGYAGESLELNAIMIRGMAELFTPKLLDFFDRRHLLSFSLRSGMTAEEFDAFVVLMSEPPSAGQAAEERERVTHAFLDQHVLHVSTLFEADVLGRERRLPWRVERALSRLGRDLSMLPLYKHATPEKIQQLKIQIIDEVIRPLRTPELLTDLLVNCDVLAKDIAVLGEAEVEHEIIAQIPAERLVSTTWKVIDALRKARETEGEEARELVGRHQLVIRHILEALGQMGIEVDGDLLEAVVSQEVFTRDQLPPSLRQLLKRQLVFRNFLTQRAAYLKGLSRFPAGKVGGQLDAVVRLVFPELLRRDHYDIAVGVLEALGSGDHEPGTGETVRVLVESLHDTLATGESVEHLLDALSDEGLVGDARDGVVALLSISGAAAAQGLQKVYGGTNSVSVRSSAFEVMKQIGAPALVPFLTTLTEIEHEWSAIHHALAALEGQTDPALADAIKPFLRHENAHVRQAALRRVFELLGPSAQDALIAALADADPATRHAAVAYLGSMHSSDPKVLEFYADALLPEDAAHGEHEHDEVLVEICRSLKDVGAVAFRDGAGVERILLDALRQEGKGKRLSGMFHKRPRYHSERVRAAICETLGAVGTAASLDTLRELAKDGDGSVAEAAAAAVEQIEQRNS